MSKIEYPSTHMGTKGDWNLLLQDMLYKPKEVVTCTCYGKTECTCGNEMEVTTHKVWVVFDPLYERVISVHSTEGGADSRCFEENDVGDRFKDCYYLNEVQEFDLEG